MLLKCFTQWSKFEKFSKFGKFSNGHRTVKDQFSFQSQRKAMPKNVKLLTIALISHASKVILKILQAIGFNSTWTENFQMFKLDLEKAEEPEIKLPTSVGSSKKQESFRKTSISALLTILKTLCESQQTVENSSRDGNTDPFTCLLRNLYAGQETTVWTGHGTTDWFKIGKGVR